MELPEEITPRCMVPIVGGKSALGCRAAVIEERAYARGFREGSQREAEHNGPAYTALQEQVKALQEELKAAQLELATIKGNTLT